MDAADCKRLIKKKHLTGWKKKKRRLEDDLLVLSLHSTARLIQRRDTVHYFRQPRASGRQLPRLLQQAHQTLLQTRAKPGRQGRQAWQIVSVKDKIAYRI